MAPQRDIHPVKHPVVQGSCHTASCPRVADTHACAHLAHRPPSRLVVVTQRRVHVYSMANLACLRAIDTEDNPKVRSSEVLWCAKVLYHCAVHCTEGFMWLALHLHAYACGDISSPLSRCCYCRTMSGPVCRSARTPIAAAR